MTPSSDVAPPVAEAEVGDWHLAVAAARGATHDANSSPTQDAVRWEADTSDCGPALLVAVADGHGHQRHQRSGRGARAAVDVCCEVMVEARQELEEVSRPGAVEKLLDDRVIPALVERWRARVLQDIADDPLPAGPALAADPIVSYGTTLIGGLLTGSQLVLLQIGDGDAVVAGNDGTSFEPIPGDDRLVLHYTTSLCQPDAVTSFRYAVVDLDPDPARWILLATDGFANAQSDANWHRRMGADLDELAAQHGARWPSAQLGEWAARCASPEGSGDDVTLALVSRR